MKTARAHSRPRVAVDMLKSLGSRLKSDERAPYETPEHDDTINFDEPTGDIVIDPRRANPEKKS